MKNTIIEYRASLSPWEKEQYKNLFGNVWDYLEYPKCKNFINIKSGKYLDNWCTKFHIHPFSERDCFCYYCYESRTDPFDYLNFVNG